MGPQGSGPGHPTPSCFSTRTGGSFSQLIVHCMPSALSQAAVQNVGRPSSVPALQERYKDFENQHPDLQVYDWAFQWNEGLPNARILPKGSKQFSKARPIIAYTKCWHTKASSFLATALYSIMQTLFPKGSTLNVNSVMSALTPATKNR